MSSLKRLQLSGRPSPQECRAVIEVLVPLHGRPNRHQHSAGLQPGCELKEPHTVLDSLVRTILSQNTTDITSQRAYTSLKLAFPDWERVRTAPAGALEAAIRVGGLADIKAARIKAILESLLVERGELSLEHLRELPGDDIKQQLGKYKGVGPKSIACVMLFCLGRAECPVDTHVWEISKQLGWVPEGASREATYEHLNAIVPDEDKYELHVLLVEHGKVCPQCCKSSGKVGNRRRKMAAAAAAVLCPLAPFKRRGFSSTDTGQLKAGDTGSSADGSTAFVSTSAAVVKTEDAGADVAAAAAVAVAEGDSLACTLQQYVCRSPAVVKLEPDQLQSAAQLDGAASNAPVDQRPTSRKRMKRW